MPVKQFKTNAKKKRVYKFQLDDREYEFTVPKIARVMLPMLDPTEEDLDLEKSMDERGWEWLKEGLSPDDYAHLRSRLDDPKDPLDIDDLTEVLEWLMGRIMGRPTKSRRG